LQRENWLNTMGGKRVPATMSAVADAVCWAEEIMKEIDERWPATKEKAS
jgi:hypothetical protein